MKKLIFDRTQLDVDNDTEKGQYTFTDLNRVESWCKHIADVLNGYNYYVTINTKCDWKESDYHYSEDLERIRNNINRLKEAYFSFTQIPANLEYMTWQKANDIEKILHEIDKIIGHMENNFIYSGVASCGQNRVWQQKFRRKREPTQLAYIESSGTQYIDTGVLGTELGGVWIDFEPTLYNNFNTIMGDRLDRGLTIALYQSIQKMYFRISGADKGRYDISVGRHTAEVKDGIVKIDGVEVQTYTTALSTYTDHVMIFNNSGKSRYFIGRVYGCKMYGVDNSLLRNYVPYKNANDEIGLYDTINGVFYPNAGTGEFIGGVAE